MLALPILIPLLMAILFLGPVRKPSAMRAAALGGAVALLFVSVGILQRGVQYGIISFQAGNWPAPYGITIVADHLSSIMLLATSCISLIVLIYSFGSMPEGKRSFIYYTLFFTLNMGVNGSFLTGDLFNLFVWFEVMILSSFVLITLGGEPEQLRGGLKYVIINLFSSFLFVAGIGLLYGKTGTLNLAHLAHILQNSEWSVLIHSSAILFFAAFSIKAALFPFFFWLPASYHTPPVAITTLFSGLLTKTGVYAMFRVFSLLFTEDRGQWQWLILVFAGATMVIGGIMAASQYDIRRILSYHIISQIGYMVMALGIFTPLALAAGIYFILHNILSKAGTFMVAGVIHRQTGSFDLRSVGGLASKTPWLAFLFILPAFSLAGFPPLSGFFGKLFLVVAGFKAQHYLITGIALLTGMFTLFSMVKIWMEAFWKPEPENDDAKQPGERAPALMIVPLAVTGLLIIVLGFASKPVMDFLMEAGRNLADPSVYVQHILKLP